MELNNRVEYKKFLEQVKNRIHTKQIHALRAVNRELIDVYFKIGKDIHAKQETLGWGKSVVETLYVQ